MALQKARQFCAYQDRSHVQVTRKLYGWGLRKTDVEQVLASLIEEQYLNEERFAINFAGGKFRMKQWGRVKIAHALKQEQVSAYTLRKALEEIDQEAYLKTLEKLARKKWASIGGQGITSLTKRAKTAAYLHQKGYEPALVNPLMSKLSAESRESTP
jgi:regulatory protein